jgi:hypothetical protein
MKKMKGMKGGKRIHAVTPPHAKLSSHAANVGKDTMAHESHNANNKACGIGCAGGGEESYQDGGSDHHMGNNVGMED